MRRRFLAGGCLLAGVLVATITLVGGCSGGSSIFVPPAVTSASVTTPLVANRANAVKVTATVLDTSGTVTAVTADLTQIGGSSTLPLTLSNVADTWTGTTIVTPTVVGSVQVSFTAIDSSNLTGQATATAIVTGSGGGNIPPVLSNPTILGSLLTNFASTINVSVVATDLDGTVQSVVVNLLLIGGLPTQPLTQSTTDPSLWTFTGIVTPPTTGTQTIEFLATDNLGATGTTSTAVVVNAPVP